MTGAQNPQQPQDPHGQPPAMPLGYGAGHSPYSAQPGYPPPPPPQYGYGPQGYVYGDPAYGGYAMYPGPASMPEEHFGGFWIRLVSYIIDAMVLAIPGMIVGFIFGLGMAAGGASGEMVLDQAQFGGNLLGMVLGWLYYAIMESRFGATVGKLAVGLRVVDENGMYPGFGRATARFFSKLLSACLLLIGFILIAFHPQKRGLHDLIAGTFIVRKEFQNPQQV
jgi:uncharacterized RDD family membrane protein YckC